MKKSNSNAALAQWKHTVSMLGWNERNFAYLRELAAELWPDLKRTRQGLLFVLSEFCPAQIRLECVQDVLPKRPSWVTAQEWHIFLEAIATSKYLDTAAAALVYQTAPKKYRQFLAENPQTPSDIRKDLLASGKPNFLTALSRNPGLDSDEILELASIGQQDIVRNLLQNNRRSRHALIAISSTIDMADPQISDVASFLSGALCSKEEFLNQIDQWLVKGDVNAMLGALYNPDVSFSLAERLKHTSASHHYQLLLASTEQMSMGEEASILLSHPMQEESVKVAVAAHANTTYETLIKLAVDESPAVRAAAVSNFPQLSHASLLYQILFDEDAEEVLASLLVRPELSNEVRAGISPKISDPWLLREVVKNAPTLPSNFFHYAIAAEPSLLGYSVQHPNCPEVFINEAKNSAIPVERVAAGLES